MPGESPGHPQRDRLLLIIACIGFVSLGLPDAVIGVAWPSIRQAFTLDQESLGLVFIGAGCGYVFSSGYAGRLVQAAGVGTLLTASSLLVALSALGYAMTPAWFGFLACALCHGLGSGAIDAGLNGFSAQHLSARHMNWLHACYCLGAMLGPLLMTGVLTSGLSWRAGYGAIAAAMLLLSLLFCGTRGRWGKPLPDDEAAPASAPVGMLATLGHPTVWLQMAIFFCYTGLESTVGQWSFTLLTEGRLVPDAAAGVAVSAYWGSIGIGRVVLGVIVERVGIDRLLRCSLLTATAGLVIYAASSSGAPSACGLLLAGLGLAPVYPCLMTRTPQRLGAGLAAHAIGFQVSAATVGAALLPGCTGLVVQQFGLPAMPLAALGLILLIVLLHEALLRRA